jgi:hypothetical protein
MSLWRVVQFKRVGEEKFTNVEDIVVIESPTWYLARLVAQRFYQTAYDAVVLEAFPFHDEEKPTHFIHEDPNVGLLLVPWGADEQQIEAIMLVKLFETLPVKSKVTITKAKKPAKKKAARKKR